MLFVVFVIDVYNNTGSLGPRREPPLVTFPCGSGAHHIDLGRILSLQRIAIGELEFMSPWGDYIAHREIKGGRYRR